MPGYILHLTAARMYLENLPASDPLKNSAEAENDFFIGNLLPDAVTDKRWSHFRNPDYKDRMMIWPRPELFLEKYRDRMEEAVYRGYYFHLFVDRKFFRDYIPGVVKFLDRNGMETEFREEVTSVLLLRTGETITPEQYASEEYYYGDYTRMNTWLTEKFHLPQHLKPGCDPGIEEVDFRGIASVLEKLDRYRDVPAEAVQDVRVFDMEDLLQFLEGISREAAEGKGMASVPAL